jgi:hypothetical protein
MSFSYVYDLLVVCDPAAKRAVGCPASAGVVVFFIKA